MNDNLIAMSVRLKKEDHKKLAELAKKETRSLSGQAVVLIKAGLKKKAKVMLTQS